MYSFTTAGTNGRNKSNCGQVQATKAHGVLGRNVSARIAIWKLDVLRPHQNLKMCPSSGPRGRIFRHSFCLPAHTFSSSDVHESPLSECLPDEAENGKNGGRCRAAAGPRPAGPAGPAGRAHGRVGSPSRHGFGACCRVAPAEKRPPASPDGHGPDSANVIRACFTACVAMRKKKSIRGRRGAGRFRIMRILPP